MTADEASINTAADSPEKDRSERLRTSSIPRLLLEFSAPAITGMIVQALYNIIDRVFVGKALGSDGIAAVTVAFPSMFIILACAMLVGIGGAASISIRLGERRKDEAEHILGNMVTLLVIISVIVTASGMLFLDPILRVFGASSEILPLARDYLGIILFGTIIQMIGFGLNTAIRSEGNPRIAMFSMLISVFINLILAPVFIFGFSWGMKGAALATVVGQISSTIWVLHYFLRGSSLLKIHRRNLSLSRPICRQILSIGFPPFLMQVVSSGLQSLMNHQLYAYGGDMAITAMGIIYAAIMFFVMPVIGLNQGAQPILGYNYGARQFLRVRNTLKISIFMATAAITAGYLIIMTFPQHIVHLFNHNDPALSALGVHAFRITMLMTPVIGFQIVGSGYFQAVGKSRTAALLMLSRQVFFLIPALIILPRIFGLNGVWAALPTADFIASIVTGAFLFRELRRLQ